MEIPSLPPPLRWREAVAADEPLLETLFAAGREDLQGVPGGAAFVQQLVRMQRQTHEAGLRQNYPRALRLVIERGGEAVGQALADIGDRELRILDIVVLPAARRGGVARAAIGALQREAAARGLTVGLMVGRTNAAAAALYAVLGFEVEEQDMMFAQMRWRAAPESAR